MFTFFVKCANLAGGDYYYFSAVEHALTPRRVYEQIKDDDGYEQSLKRTRRNTACSRSLDDLTSLSVDRKYTIQLTLIHF